MEYFYNPSSLVVGCKGFRTVLRSRNRIVFLVGARAGAATKCIVF
jgi:hypothetical protein